MRYLKKICYITTLVVLLLVQLGCQSQFPIADLILENGKFFTADEDRPLAEAVAVKNTRILAVGSTEEIGRFKGERTRIIDLEGRFGCPGFNDARMHLMIGVIRPQLFDLRGVASYQDIRRRLIPQAWNYGVNEWILGWGWDNTIFENGEMPDSRMLNRINEYAPILLIRKCGDVAVVNSKALSIAGITADTPSPPGGEIGKDPVNGQPNGIMKGTAMDLFSQFFQELNSESIRGELKKVLRDVRRWGITSIQENTTNEMAHFFQDIEAEGELTCRITLNIPYNSQDRLKPIKEPGQGNKLRFGHFTLYLDGCLSSWSAHMLQPYADKPASHGLEKWNKELLNRMVVTASRKKVPLAFSAFGSFAARAAVNNFEVMNFIDSTKSCFLIENLKVVNNETLAKMASHSTIAAIMPVQMIDDMRWLESRLGNQRLKTAYRMRTLKNQGITLAFGTDWPVAPMNPMMGLYAAVARRDTSGYPPGGWNLREKISIEEAITAYTLGSAAAECMEKEKGSLEPGKLADIVVLDRNLIEAQPLDILKTRVVFTIVGGELVYDRYAGKN